MAVTESKTWPRVDPHIGPVAVEEKNKYSLHRKSHNPAPQKISTIYDFFYIQSVYNSRCLFTVKCYGSLQDVSLRYCISNAHVILQNNPYMQNAE
jgi:hypothetical protein